MTDDGVRSESEPMGSPHPARADARVRARVVAWPEPGRGSDIYGVRVAGPADAVRSFGAAARDAGLWVSRTDGEAVVVSGPCTALRAFSDRTQPDRGAIRRLANDARSRRARPGPLDAAVDRRRPQRDAGLLLRPGTLLRA
jgi:hypothetical protein